MRQFTAFVPRSDACGEEGSHDCSGDHGEAAKEDAPFGEDERPAELHRIGHVRVRPRGHQATWWIERHRSAVARDGELANGLHRHRARRSGDESSKYELPPRTLNERHPVLAGDGEDQSRQDEEEEPTECNDLKRRPSTNVGVARRPAAQQQPRHEACGDA
jgi:hypothetical protein